MAEKHGLCNTDNDGMSLVEVLQLHTPVSQHAPSLHLRTPCHHVWYVQAYQMDILWATDLLCWQTILNMAYTPIPSSMHSQIIIVCRYLRKAEAELCWNGVYTCRATVTGRPWRLRLRPLKRFWRR